LTNVSRYAVVSRSADTCARVRTSQIQFQCVSARKVKSFYKLVPANGRAEYEVDREQERNYTSYLRYTTLGLLLVNRRWPWVLDRPTHYDAYIGVDVLRNTAAFTFFSYCTPVIFGMKSAASSRTPTISSWKSV